MQAAHLPDACAEVQTEKADVIGAMAHVMKLLSSREPEVCKLPQVFEHGLSFES